MLNLAAATLMAEAEDLLVFASNCISRELPIRKYVNPDEQVDGEPG
jgi:hypothetical protein